MRCGERRARRLQEFCLRQLTREFTGGTVADKSIMLTTTNGAEAIRAATAGARDVLVGSHVNLSVVLWAVRTATHQGMEVVFVCAGHDRRSSLEDAACAGRFVRFVTGTSG